jgi:hypothetical protein
MVAVFALTVLAVPAFGGRLGRVGSVNLRWPSLILVSLLIQIAITSVFEVSKGVGTAFHLVSYVPLAAFFVLNRTTPGVLVTGTGTALNLIAIAANGGTMPARASAVKTAGIPLQSAFENSAPVRDANLWFLGDIFAVPKALPLANVFSVGDVLIVLGAAWFIHAASGSRLASAKYRSPVDAACEDQPAGSPAAIHAH